MPHNFYKTENDIIAWLNAMRVKNYTLIPSPEYGYTVDVQGDVNLQARGLSSIPIKFNNISGSFICHSNAITTLLGCPTTVSHKFFCSSNKLTNLIGSPQKAFYFDCSNNELITLAGGPSEVSFFSCANNKLTNLKGSPKILLDPKDPNLSANFVACNNLLTTLEGITEHIPVGLFLQGNKINSLAHIPKSVVGSIYLEDNSHPQLNSISERAKYTHALSYSQLYELHLIDYAKDLLERNVTRPPITIKSPQLLVHRHKI